MAGLPTGLEDPSLTCDGLRIELRGFAQNELRRELKACLVELRPQLKEDMQACIKEVVATSPPRFSTRFRSSSRARESSTGRMFGSQFWACPSPPRKIAGSTTPEPPTSPKDCEVVEPEGAPRMLPPIRDSDSRPSAQESVAGSAVGSTAVDVMQIGETDSRDTAHHQLQQQRSLVRFKEGDVSMTIDDHRRATLSSQGSTAPAPDDETYERMTVINKPHRMQRTVSSTFSSVGHQRSWNEEFTQVDSIRYKARAQRTRMARGNKGLTFRTYASDSLSRMSRLESIMKSFSPSAFKDKEGEEEQKERSCFERIIQAFQYVEASMDWPVSIAIALNGLFLGVQAQFQSHNLSEAVPPVFTVFECIFCVLFTGELFIRLISHGLSFFYKTGWRWNWFDTCLVTMSLIEVVGIFGGQHETSTTNKATDMSFLRLLRILRALRVLRLIRLVQFIAELNMIISSITNCMRSLFWTMVLLLLMVYIMGIFFTQLVFSFRIENRAENRDDNDDHMQALVYWWGSLFRSTLSLYEAILGGADWDSLVFPMARKISVLVVPIFVLYIAFSMLAMMNVITGIFVETALKNAALDKDNEFITLTREVFADDVDEVGILKRGDFIDRVDQQDMAAYLKTIGIEPKDAKLMFYLLDGDKNGSLDLEALMAGMLRLRAGAKALDIALMMSEYEAQASKWMEQVDELEQQVDKVMMEIDALRSQVGMRPSMAPPRLMSPTIS